MVEEKEEGWSPDKIKDPKLRKAMEEEVARRKKAGEVDRETYERLKRLGDQRAQKRWRGSRPSARTPETRRPKP